MPRAVLIPRRWVSPGGTNALRIDGRLAGRLHPYHCGSESARGRRPMADWEKVGVVGDVPTGDMREIEAHGERLVLANLDGTYYAFGAWCTHVGTSLAM